jgi:hypothetical protein
MFDILWSIDHAQKSVISIEIRQGALLRSSMKVGVERGIVSHCSVRLSRW